MKYIILDEFLVLFGSKRIRNFANNTCTCFSEMINLGFWLNSDCPFTNHVICINSVIMCLGKSIKLKQGELLKLQKVFYSDSVHGPAYHDSLRLQCIQILWKGIHITSSMKESDCTSIAYDSNIFDHSQAWLPLPKSLSNSIVHEIPTLNHKVAWTVTAK